MSTKFVQSRRALLQSAISDSDTSMTVTEFVDLSGNDIEQVDIGTVGYGTLAPNTAKEEAISFTIDSNTGGVAVLTITRGLLGKQPYGTGGTAYSHNAGTEFILSNNPDLFNKLTAKDNEEEVTADWKFPLDPSHDQNPVPKKYLEDNAVMKTGAQTVEGVKTFSDSPIIPDATEDNEPYNKGQVDDLDAANVKLTGDQTVAGVKTFSSSPVVPDAVNDNQPFTKGQFDSAVEDAAATASQTVRGTTKLDTAADDPLDPEALTATADRVGALAGGGDLGTPSASNKFVTEEGISNPAFKPPQVVTFTSSGTWTKDAGLKYIIVEGVGGGAGGDYDNGYGGGAGGYFKKLILASALGATETVTIGAAGSGGIDFTTTDATPGGNTSFGSHATANGGAISGQGGTATGGDINVSGGNGQADTSGTGGNVGRGGDSRFGQGGVTQEFVASGYGAGGRPGQTSSDGENGRPGLIVLTEYYS